MRRALAGLAAALCVSCYGVAAPAATAHAAPAVRGTDCFDGPFAHNHASPGATCATGFWCLPGSHPAFPSDWCLAKRREHGVDVVVIDHSHTEHVNGMELVLVGYVNDGWGHGRQWPFNPVKDKRFCQVPRAHGRHVCAPVLLFEWTGGNPNIRHPECLHDPSTSRPDQKTHWFRCSPVGQGRGDRYDTFMVWAGEGKDVPISWQRIVGVKITNAHGLGSGDICLTSPIPEQHAAMSWIDSLAELLYVQVWQIGGP